MFYYKSTDSFTKFCCIYYYYFFSLDFLCIINCNLESFRNILMGSLLLVSVKSGTSFMMKEAEWSVRWPWMCR